MLLISTPGVLIRSRNLDVDWDTRRCLEKMEAEIGRKLRDSKIVSKTARTREGHNADSRLTALMSCQPIV